MTDTRLIVREIEKIWKSGIRISPEVLFFLESTFGMTTAAEFEAVWEEDDSCDQEMVLEMLLFPDHQMRMSIEPALGRDGLNEEAVTSIAHALSRKFPTLQVTHSSWEKELRIPVSTDQAALFVSRLFLARSVDAGIDRALERCRPQEERLAARVWLRCRPIDVKDDVRQMLICFIENTNDMHPPFPSLFRLLADTLISKPVSLDARAVLIDRRKQEKQRLEQIQAFEEKQDRYGMEYLMMQRYPVPVDSFENTYDRLVKLDIIINDILGMDIPLSPVPPVVQTLGQFDPATDLKTVFNLLS
jgi:hypothetical protein